MTIAHEEWESDMTCPSTYLTTDLTVSTCIYTVCKCNPLVHQLRLDFNSLELAPPFTCGSSSTSVACTATDGPLIGRTCCIIDGDMLYY